MVPGQRTTVSRSDRGDDSAGQRLHGGSFRRFLGWAVLGALVPGSALIATGRRRSGSLILGGWIGLLVGVAIGAVMAGPGGLVAMVSDAGTTRILGVALLVAAAAWLVVAIVSLYTLQSPELNGSERFVGAVAVAAAMSLVVAPLALGAQYSRTHTELLDRVFSSGDQHSLTVPTPLPEAAEADPWGGHARVNVLLLGSDAAEEREGVRPDSLIVASVDTETGDTVLLSLPRNLQRVPFPEDSPLHERYPEGFDGPGDRNAWLLNAIYERVPAGHPDVFTDSSYPGADATKWAVEGVLGVDIDYFVMVNLEGFERVIDALGGITIDVNYRVPIGTQLNPRTGECTPARDWIEPGPDQVLDGPTALWYARARCGPYPVTDDYNRMERQRCVIGAVIDEAHPITLLRQYERLADAAGDMVVSDIPQGMLPAFVDLGRKVQNASVTSLAFTDDVIQSRMDPDFDRIRDLTASALSSTREDEAEVETNADEGAAREAAPTMAPAAEPAADDGSEDADSDASDSDADGKTDAEADPTTAQPLDAIC